MEPDEFFESPDETLFQKESRVLTYQGDSSVRLTERELNAYRIRVVLAPFYSAWRPNANLQYTPPRELYGRVTHHNGSNGVIKDSLLQYQRQVIFDWRNEGMLTRYWSAILAELYFPVVKMNVLALAESIGEGLLFPQVPILYNVNLNERQLELWATQLTTGIYEETGEGGRPILPQWGWPPPESLWKLQADRLGLWCQWEVDSWHLPVFPGISIAGPDAANNDENSNGDSESPEPRPTPGQPPDPEDESPSDPRNLPEDYSTAEPEEPEEPPEPVNAYISISGDYGIEFPSGVRAPGATGQQTFCVAVTQPPPTIQSSTSIDGVPNNGGWRYSYTTQSGERVTLTIGATGIGATPYGSPQVEAIPC